MAIELICAAQSYDYHNPLKSGPIISAIHKYIRTQIDHAEEDRVFAHDINKAIQIIEKREILNIYDKTAKKLKISTKTKFEKYFEKY